MNLQVDSWPFEDTEHLATFTVSDVLEGAKPVLEVSHDVFDGSWQFLTGAPIELDDAKLVPLREVIFRDPSLVELANLPLGWRAARVEVGKDWVRSPQFPTDWDELLSHACEHTEIQQARLKTEFSLSVWERYDCRQKGATLMLSSGRLDCFTARIQIVGSTSKSSGTWRWAWDDANILDEASEFVHLLRRYGAQHNFERLVRSEWAADEVDGWEMTSIACLLLGGEGVYCATEESGGLFMVLTNPRIIEAPATAVD